MQFINIKVPIVDSGNTEEQARRKILEALDDLISELCVQPIDKAKTVETFLAAGQGIMSFIQAGAKDILVGEDVTLYLEEFFQKSNEEHIEKVRLQSAERGWKI